MNIQKAGSGHYFLAGGYLTSIRDFALKQGVSVDLLIEGTDLTLEDLLTPPERIGELSMYRLGSNLTSNLDNPLQSTIEYGGQMAVNTHGALGTAVQATKNLGEACDLLVQYIKTRSNLVKLDKISTHDCVSLRLNETGYLNPGEFDLVRFFFYFSTLLNMEMVGRGLVKHIAPNSHVQINVNMPEPIAFPHHHISKNIKVAFNQSYFELCIPSCWMEVDINSANSDLVVLATTQCQNELSGGSPSNLVDRVQETLRSIEGPKPSMDEMAIRLHMSTSTFQRRLKDLKTTYKKIKNEECVAEATYLLSNTLYSVEQIAEKLGFSDASNFSKFFKSMVKMTPREYRKDK